MLINVFNLLILKCNNRMSSILLCIEWKQRTGGYTSYIARGEDEEVLLAHLILILTRSALGLLLITL